MLSSHKLSASPALLLGYIRRITPQLPCGSLLRTLFFYLVSGDSFFILTSDRKLCRAVLVTLFSGKKSLFNLLIKKSPIPISIDDCLIKKEDMEKFSSQYGRVLSITIDFSKKPVVLTLESKKEIDRYTLIIQGQRYLKNNKLIFPVRLNCHASEALPPITSDNLTDQLLQDCSFGDHESYSKKIFRDQMRFIMLSESKEPWVEAYGQVVEACETLKHYLSFRVSQEDDEEKKWIEEEPPKKCCSIL